MSAWLWAWAIATASDGAAELKVETTEQGSQRGSVVVSAEVSAVAAIVRDPVRVGQLVGDARTTVRAVDDGACHTVTTETKHPIMAVSYVARGCPTDEGYRMELVESSQLRRFRSVWTVREVPTGTEVTFDLEVKPSFPLPGMIVRRSSRKGVVDSLEALRRHFGGA